MIVEPLAGNRLTDNLNSPRLRWPGRTRPVVATLDSGGFRLQVARTDSASARAAKGVIREHMEHAAWEFLGDVVSEHICGVISDSKLETMRQFGGSWFEVKPCGHPARPWRAARMDTSGRTASRALDRAG